MKKPLRTVYDDMMIQEEHFKSFYNLSVFTITLTGERYKIVNLFKPETKYWK